MLRFALVTASGVVGSLIIGGEALVDKPVVKQVNVTLARTIPYVDLSPSGTGLCPDGKAIGVGFWTKRPNVRIWEIHSGDVLALEGHWGGTCGVALSRDELVATGGNDGTVRLWSRQDGKSVAVAECHKSSVERCAFSKDGKMLATCSLDQDVCILQVPTLKLLGRLREHQEGVESLVFLDDDELLASASEDGTIKLWDVKTLKSVATLAGHNQRIPGLATSPDGATLASASWDGTVRLWDARRAAEKCRIDCKMKVWAVAFSHDGKWLAAAGDVSEGKEDMTGMIRIWDLATMKEVAAFYAHRHRVVFVAFSRDDKSIISRGNESTPMLIQGAIKVWSFKPSGASNGTFRAVP